MLDIIAGEQAQGTENWLEEAREVLRVEAEAISRMARRLDDSFERALDLMDACEGKIIVTGMGKSGLAGRKIASTLTSTGCAAVFLHPGEAIHGDLGIVMPGDVVIALSNGGESEELLAILPALIARHAPIIAIVGNLDSTLAQKSDVILNAEVEREACPLNLAPTTSVIAALAMGDALAMTLEKRRGFRPEDYARNHPGGRLGRRLTLKVSDLMCGKSDLPTVPLDAKLMDVLCEISAKRLGAAGVVGGDQKLAGIITDFDVRQAVQKFTSEAFNRTAAEIMNAHPVVLVHPDQLAYDALRLMEDRPRPISVCPVTDTDGVLVGMLHVHDLIRAGL